MSLLNGLASVGRLIVIHDVRKKEITTNRIGPKNREVNRRKQRDNKV